MNATTLHAYQQSRAVSWARADCDHVPGIWRRESGETFPDKRNPELHLSHCVTECRTCGVKLRGAFTQRGTLREYYGEGGRG